jgi:parallel beta-helix repeat protein
MSPSRLRHWLVRLSRVERRRHSPARRRPIFRPYVEAMEDRFVPSTTLTVMNTADSGAGSLRQAILDSNSAGSAQGANIIQFELTTSASTINLLTELPAISASVIMDASSIGGFVSVYGNALSATSSSANGLTVKASGCTLKFLAFYDFPGAGVELDSNDNTINTVDVQNSAIGISLPSGASANNILGCYESTDKTGFSLAGGATGNTIQGGTVYYNAVGVSLVGGSTGNLVGGTAASIAGVPEVTEGNQIGANGIGVLISDSGTTNNTVEGNNIFQGATAGVEITNGATGNLIGGLSAAAGNIVSSYRSGILLHGTGTTGNMIEGNLIGTNPLFVGAPSVNGAANEYGVVLEAGASGNMIGGTATGAGNTIGSSTGLDFVSNPTSPSAAVFISGSGTSGNLIQGNNVGTDPSGLANVNPGSHPSWAPPSSTLANFIGVYICNGATNNTIGGTAVGAGNLFSTNFAGVWVTDAGTTGNMVESNTVGTNSDGTEAMPNTVGVVAASGASSTTIQFNLISGNYIGVMLYATSDNTVASNVIGASSGAKGPLPNTYGVVAEAGAAGNLIGGSVDGDGNTIAYNSGIPPTSEGIYPSAGVLLVDKGTTGNLLEGNGIGITTFNVGSGAAAFGVYVANGASDNTIGGTAGVDRNVISGNFAGVWITGNGTAGNAVAGNYIGTSLGGDTAVSNAAGICVTGNASGNTISGNTISGNYIGVMLYAATTNAVSGNQIGTDATGSSALPNTFGVVVEAGAADNTIDSSATAAANVVSGNSGVGIYLDGAGTSGNVVGGNFIGTLADGTTALGNGSHGVLIDDQAANNTIGGTASGTANVIAFNGGAGVLIGADPTQNAAEAGTGNAVLGNAIFSNTGLGIDLGPSDGVTPNGFNNNVGPNNYQNYPVLTSAALSGGHTVVSGTLHSSASTTFRVEIFANAAADPSGNGQGQTFLGFTSVTTDAGGGASFSATLNAAAAGQAISATATDPAGNTSEFAANVTAS